MRTPLALACLAVAVAAVPAAADPLDDAPPRVSECAVAVAPAGPSTAGCTTYDNAVTLSGSIAARNLRLTVLAGSATATLSCAGDPVPSVTVTLGKPGTDAATLLATGRCSVILSATSPETAAIAWNVSTYVFP
jgi:hypothetical protein